MPSPSSAHRMILAEKLAESLASPIPALTPRKVHGVLSLPGKATAVVGMRRAGKTTFLHQIRRDRLKRGARREDLPCINFEDERLAELRAEHLGFLLEEYGPPFARTCHRDARAGMGGPTLSVQLRRSAGACRAGAAW